MTWGFQQNFDPEFGVIFLTIARDTSDFPDNITMRARLIGRGGDWFADLVIAPICGLYDSLEGARRDVPPGACRFGRHETDDPVIVECWML